MKKLFLIPILSLAIGSFALPTKLTNASTTDSTPVPFVESVESSQNSSGGYKIIDPSINPNSRISNIELYSIPTGNSTLNKASSTEYENWSTLTFTYTGDIRFNPSYLTPSNPGYYLDSGRYVKQAYFNYMIGDKSLTGGRVYTSLAPNQYINQTFSVTRTVSDTLIPGNPKTQFFVGWSYFG